MSDPYKATGRVRGVMNPLLGSVLSLLFLGMGPTSARAATLDISAFFIPDPTNPANNSFVNTTPVSGYCSRYPADCLIQKINSFNLPITASAARTIIADHADLRSGVMLKTPASYRSVNVHSEEGKIANVQLRIAGLGFRKVFDRPVRDISGGSNASAAHNALWWGGSWIYNTNAAPCGVTSYGLPNVSSYTFFWKTPVEAACGKKPRYDLENFRFDELNISYELITPEPLLLSNGNYTGSITYSIGPGGDFDFGDVLVPNDSSLTINFSLTVQHVFALRFPPGADRLALVPEGGWQQWLQRGRRPEKLFANQSFEISSSTTFKMLLQCQYPVGDQCGIQNGAGDLVPVETRVTLPTGIVALTGTAVNRYPLSNSNARIFNPSQYVDNGRAELHFEVNRDSVVQMTNHAGSSYSGNVTMVFDSVI